MTNFVTGGDILERNGWSLCTGDQENIFIL